MKRLAWESDQLWINRLAAKSRGLRPVNAIADDGMPLVLQVNADLVRAPGVELKAQQRDLRETPACGAGCNDGFDAPFGQRLASARQRAYARHFFPIAPVPADRPVDRAGGFRHTS